MALTGMVVVSPQDNPALPASEVTPQNPEEKEAGALGVGPEVRPELNEGIDVPDGIGESAAPEIAGEKDNGNDSEYIDELLYPNPDGFADSAEMVSPSYFADETLQDRKPQTKVLQATVPIGNFDGSVSFDPVMLFPADSDRVELILRAVSANASTWRFASDKQSCYTAAEIPTSDPALVLRHHTGPVWVYSTDTTNAFVLNGWSVTK